MKRKKIAFFFFFSVYQIGTLVMMSIQKYSPENFSYTIMMIFVYCLGQFPSLLLFPLSFSVPSPPLLSNLKLHLLEAKGCFK